MPGSPKIVCMTKLSKKEETKKMGWIKNEIPILINVIMTITIICKKSFYAWLREEEYVYIQDLNQRVPNARKLWRGIVSTDLIYLSVIAPQRMCPVNPEVFIVVR